MSELKQISQSGRYNATVEECYLSNDDKDRYFIYFHFKTLDDEHISARRYLGTDKQVEYVESSLKDAFHLPDSDTIDTIVEKRLEELKGKQCRLVIEENNYEKDGKIINGFSVKYINSYGLPRANTSDFKSRIRAIRNSQIATKPAQPDDDGDPF